jgi:hypothetical protein
METVLVGPRDLVRTVCNLSLWNLCFAPLLALTNLEYRQIGPNGSAEHKKGLKHLRFRPFDCENSISNDYGIRYPF